jgi:undecaprenyl-diphosphatase
MDWLSILILALVQGATEFLPVSSSGHLVLAHALLGHGQGWGENALMDVAVHVGTLGSVLVYFRSDVWAMARAPVGRLALQVAVGSVPVVLAGLALHLAKPDALRGLEVVAWTTLLGGVLLWWVDARAPVDRSVEGLSWRGALLIGLAQATALVPGVSRSGITMTAGRACGLTRPESARFSLLLGIVAIAGSGVLGAKDLVESGDAHLGADVALAAFLSFAVGWAAIVLMMRFLARASFAVFGAYRIALGAALLAALYAGAL